MVLGDGETSQLDDSSAAEGNALLVTSITCVVGDNEVTDRLLERLPSPPLPHTP